MIQIYKEKSPWPRNYSPESDIKPELSPLTRGHLGSLEVKTKLHQIKKIYLQKLLVLQQWGIKSPSLTSWAPAFNYTGEPLVISIRKQVLFLYEKIKLLVHSALWQKHHLFSCTLVLFMPLQYGMQCSTLAYKHCAVWDLHYFQSILC